MPTEYTRNTRRPQNILDAGTGCNEATPKKFKMRIPDSLFNTFISQCMKVTISNYII